MEKGDLNRMTSGAGRIEPVPATCRRCAGCGRVGGVGAGERPWSEFVGMPVHCLIPKLMGMQRPRTCPDCGGSGSAGT